ncbi:WD40 repeat domain-containing protein, partial [Frankia sp. Cas3]|uniref:WD40 repeat domain-containing protein n=1 Tax=Frankia sp. Cas3 TaxID=3073926 RepID=UPI002AD3131D
MDEQRGTGSGAFSSNAQPVDGALRAWAVAHARTVGRTGDPSGMPPWPGGARPAGPGPRWDEPWGPGDIVVTEPPATLTGHTSLVYSVGWATGPDGQLLLATGNYDDTVRIWDPHTGHLLHTLTGHTGWVGSVGWAAGPGGRLLLATGSADATVRIWNPHTGHTLHTLTGHTGRVLSVGWATGPDGRLLLASGSADATVRIWNPHTGHTLHTLTGHTGRVLSVGWATGPDGRLLLASGSADATVRIWDPHTGHTLHTLTGHTSTVRSVGWATGPDGRLLLASGSDDATVRIWDPHTGHTLHTLTGHTSTVRSVGWATGPDGRLLLASGSADATVRIWDPHTGHTLHTLTGHTNWVNSVGWATGPDGRLLLASGSADRTVRIWDVEVTSSLPAAAVTTGDKPAVPATDPTPRRPRVVGSHVGQVWSLAFVDHADGSRQLVSGGADGAVMMWDTQGSGASRTITRHESQVRAIAACELGRSGSVASVSEDGTNRVTVIDGDAAPTQDWLGGALRAVATTRQSDGSWLLAYAGDSAIVHTQHMLPATSTVDGWRTGMPSELSGHDNRVLALAFGVAVNGQPVLASGGLDRTIRLWSPPDWDPEDSPRLARGWEPLAELDGHTGWVTSLAFAAGEGAQLLLASASHDHTVRIWDVISGRLLQTLEGHGAPVWTVCWVPWPDGRRMLASGGNDGNVRIWDADAGDQIDILSHPTDVLTVAASTADDGTPIIVTGGDDGQIRRWDLPRSDEPWGPGDVVVTEPSATLTGHTAWVWSVGWATGSDGRLLLASGSADATVRIWNPTTGHTLRTLTGHTGPVLSVGWATGPDGRLLLASGSADATVRIWNPTTGHTLHTLTGHTSPVWSVGWA